MSQNNGEHRDCFDRINPEAIDRLFVSGETLPGSIIVDDPDWEPEPLPSPLLLAGRVLFVLMAVLTLMAFALSLAGCRVVKPIPGPGPVSPEDIGGLDGLAFKAEREHSRLRADAYAALAKELRAGKITSADALKARIGTISKQARDDAFRSRDEAFDYLQYPGDVWSKDTAASGLEAISNGLRRASR